MSAVSEAYADGYAEGRRTALHLVVPLAESVVLQAARENGKRGGFDSFRAYWLGMARGVRAHYSDAYRPSVLEARARAVQRARIMALQRADRLERAGEVV